jgi:signal transduction histidine kinase
MSEASAAALTAVGSFATGLAHEINNPLAVVRTNVEEAVRVAGDLLGIIPKYDTRARADADELKAMLEETLAAAQRIEAIVRDLRPFACPEDRRTRVDVSALIESAATIAFAEIRHRARLKKELASGLHVLGSEIKLGQALFNLLVNAAQAMPEGEAHQNEIVVSSREEGGSAVIEFADTGTGIQDVDKAFTPFHSTRGRPGMGLPIARAVVLEHRGTITVVPNGKRGTVVRVTLPLEG